VFHEGRLVLRSSNAPAAPMMERGKDFKSGFDTVAIGGSTWRVFAATGEASDVQVYVGEEATSRAAILWAVLRSTLWPMLVAVPLLALAAWWAVYRGVAPLRELGQMLARRQPQALHPLQVTGAPSEMLPMLTALNALFERIGTLLESERRFTADAAHELRTPIAAIRAQAQVALGESDDAARRHALLGTLEGCDRATHLVEQMLTLSRLEAGTTPAMGPIDLNAVARRVVAELAPQAIGKQQTLELDADAACDVIGDEALLSVLVRNLVDNAIRYSPTSASVKVRVQRRPAEVVLTVDDAGPGMSAADQERLGERFFRVPGSGESGSGRSASIVRRIAAAHQAQLRVEPSAELGGLSVGVTLRQDKAAR